jgi:DNA polymerase I-like protein with 3'-5' exonuclease and polymerase domains
VQGTAADLVKMKMVRLYAERETLGLTLRMMVHDAFVGDCEVGRLPHLEVALAVQEMPLTVPVLYDSHLGDNWAEAG